MGLALRTAEKTPAAAVAPQCENQINEALHEGGDLETSNDCRQSRQMISNSPAKWLDTVGGRQLVSQRQEVGNRRQELGAKLNSKGLRLDLKLSSAPGERV
jgi:hypothetical protein